MSKQSPEDDQDQLSWVWTGVDKRAFLQISTNQRKLWPTFNNDLNMNISSSAAESATTKSLNILEVKKKQLIFATIRIHIGSLNALNEETDHSVKLWVSQLEGKVLNKYSPFTIYQYNKVHNLKICYSCTYSLYIHNSYVLLPNPADKSVEQGE